MKYKLFVVDIDGTLVGRDGVISDENKRALDEVRRSGMKIAISTGRVAKACSDVMNELSLDGDHMFFDGAFVGNPELGSEVFVQPLDTEIVSQIVEFVRANELYMEFYTSSGYFVEREGWETEMHRRLFDLKPTVVDFDTLGSERIIKGEMAALTPGVEGKIRAMQDWFDGRLRFTWGVTPVFPNTRITNVLTPTASKGKALEALASNLGIDLSEVVAIGDANNDIPLFSVAGLSIAMGNASDEVKQLADCVTLDVENSGLARAVERFLI